MTPIADPLSTHTGGTPLDQPSPITVMIQEGIDNRLPIPSAVPAGNGLNIESNPKHTPGGQGFSPRAGIEPRNSLELFGNSVALPDDIKHS